jgi:replicative DNA helicase
MSFEANKFNEYFIISYYFKNPGLWSDIRKDLFCIKTSRQICEALEKMFVNGIKVFDFNTLYNYLRENNVEINIDNLKAIYDEHTNYENIQDAFKILERDKARQIVNTDLLENLFENVHTNLKTETDIDNIITTLDGIQEKIGFIRGRDDILLNSEKLVANHIKVRERRKTEKKRTTGDSALDRLLINPFAPKEQTTIFGQKSSGKSTYAQNIASCLTLRRIPVIYFNLEMGAESWMDKSLCMRTGFPLNIVMYPESDDQDRDITTALDSMRGLRTFHLVEEPVITFSDWERMINKVQRLLGVEYLVTFFDLTTMIQEYSNAKNAKEIERCCNIENEILKRTGTHAVNIVQENENRFRGNKINKVKSLKYFKPKITDIKEAAAIAERSRVVVYVWNEELMKKSFFPEEEDDTGEDDDKPNFLEVKVVKQNMGRVGGTARYVFDAPCFRLTPYNEGKK